MRLACDRSLVPAPALISAVGLLLAAVLVGCGSESGSTSDAVSSQPRAAAQTPSDTNAPASAKTAPATTSTLHFDLTDHEGWHYTGDVPVPTGSITFEKDISASPPGSANMTATIDGYDTSPQTFADDNPGRSGGPDLVVSPGYLAFNVPTDITEGESSSTNVPTSFGDCSIGGDSFYEPFEGQVQCSIPNGTASVAQGSGPSEDGSEKAVDNLVSSLQGADPTYVVNFDPTSRACNVFIAPDGTITKSKSYASDCGTKSLKLTLNGPNGTSTGP